MFTKLLKFSKQIAKLMPDYSPSIFRRLSEQALLRHTDPVLWIDQQGVVLRINPAASQLYGYSEAQFTSITVFDLNPNMNREKWELHWRQDRRRPTKIQTNHRKADGKMITVEVYNCWLETEGQHLSCSIVRDISSREKQQANLKRLWEQSRQQDRQALLSQFSIERTHDAVIWSCPKGHIKYANPEACIRLGYTAEEMQERQIRDINPNFTTEVLHNFWKTLRTAGSVLMESEHHKRSGETLPVEINSNYIAYEGMEYACSIVRDISERKKQEASLKAALEGIKLLKDRLEAENVYLQAEIRHQTAQSDIITGSERMQRILYQIEQVAPTDSTVLITGESGTGKELVANAIHRFSKRGEQAFVKINCAALPEQLIESELFGHEKGAFTGALQRKVGKFELADGGTLFLDEVGELPLHLQAKLLRAIQSGEIERLGGSETIRTNVRLLAATNRDLEQMVQAGTFRNDLYFRIFVFPIHLPPLRERPEDIPLLVRHFVGKYQARIGKKIRPIDAKTLVKLQEYPFPGNIRELENMVERALILAKDGRLRFETTQAARTTLPRNEVSEPSQTTEKITTLADAQRAHIIRALQACNWRVSGKQGAAALLDLPPTTLRSKMEKLGIKRSMAAE